MRYTNILENKEKLDLIELSYKFQDLNSVFSKDSVKFHYDVLSRGYVDRFNKNEGDEVFNRAGAFLHNIWWAQFKTPSDTNKPMGVSLAFIDKHFETYPDFKNQIIDLGTKFQGSGWIYLANDGSIKEIKNHSVKNDIILLIDLWEHAYYLDYPADKKSYLKSIWRCIDWNVINDRINLSG